MRKLLPLLYGLILSACAGLAPAQPTVEVGAWSPSSSYAEQLPDDPTPIVSAPGIYRAEITGIYDPDTLEANIYQGYDTWRRDVRLRLVGTNAYEITRKQGTTAAQVKISKQCRLLLVDWLGGDRTQVGDKAKLYHLSPPIEVILEVGEQETGKYGRVLPVLWKDGKNINQYIVRSGCSPYVTYYDGLKYAATTPIFTTSPKARDSPYKLFSK